MENELEYGAVKVANLADASRYAYGLSETRKEMQSINETAEAEIAIWQAKIDEVNQWRENELKPLKEKESFFTLLLTDYHRREFTNAPNEKAQNKVKSIKLPYGITLSSRQNPVKFQVTDEEKLIQYAQEHDKVTTTVKADWAKIKDELNAMGDKVFNSDGEVLDFVEPVYQERSFEIK